MKSVQTQTFSGPHFSVFELNTDIYKLNLRIQSKYGKIRTRKISVLRPVNEGRVIALVQSVTQANQFDRGIDCAGNVTNFTGNRADKFLFSQDSKEICSYIFVSAMRKGKI